MLMLRKRSASVVYPCKRKHVARLHLSMSTSYSNSKKRKETQRNSNPQDLHPSSVFRRLAEIQHLGGEQAWPLCGSQKSVIKPCERKVQDQLDACAANFSHLNVDPVPCVLECLHASVACHVCFSTECRSKKSRDTQFVRPAPFETHTFTSLM